MNSSLSKYIMVILGGFLLSLPGFAEEAPEENPPANQAQEESVPDAPEVTETQPEVKEVVKEAAKEPKVTYTKEENETTGEKAVKEAAAEEKNFRDQGLFDRIKTLVKRFDAQERKGLEYPSKMVESAIRAEFMRRTEGGEGPGWLKKRTRDADKEVAMDNLEMLIHYAERLGWAAPSKKAKDAKEAAANALEIKLLAAKAVVDRYNVRRSGDRGPASFTGFAPTKGLSATGKAELARRRILTAGQVAGDDFQPITGKKFDDFVKKYRATLTATVMEYEKLAQLVAGGTPPITKAERAPASKKPTKKNGKKNKKHDD